jgi:hypothetical protein
MAAVQEFLANRLNLSVSAEKRGITAASKRGAIRRVPRMRLHVALATPGA